MTIQELLETRAEEDGENPFVYFQGQKVGFATFEREANHVANALREVGIRKGDQVCLLLPNSLEFLYLWFGLAKIGGVIVPLSPDTPKDNLKYIINHSDAESLVVDKQFHDVYRLIEADLSSIRRTIWKGHETPSGEGFYSLSDLMGVPQGKDLHFEDVKDEDPAAIIYTRGINSHPRGVMISHFSYVLHARVWTDDIIQWRDDDVFLTSLPLSHIGPQVCTIIASLASGRPCVLQKDFLAPQFLDEIRRYRATVFDYTGRMLSDLMAQAYQATDSNNPARLACGTGAREEIWRDFEERFRVKIIEGYRLTETGGLVLSNRPESVKIGSIGKPTRFCDVMIWDENNQEIPTGQAGEIVIREKVPHSMFLEYFKQPDRTLEAWDGGAFHTGDFGYKDGDGFFYFVGRNKDCLRRGGEVISLANLEKVVNSHPKVLKSLAVLASAAEGENEIKIYAIPKKNEILEPEEIVTFCKETMVSPIIPRSVELVRELPKTRIE